MILVEYHSNNSGGFWWLKDDNWKNLENNGWRVVWATLGFVYENNERKLDEDGLPVLVEEKGIFCKDGRYMGSLSRGYAFKKFNSITEALFDFEKTTNQKVTEQGCNCCGPPHCFSWEDNYCSGEECLEYMFKEVPSNLREVAEKSGNRSK